MDTFSQQVNELKIYGFTVVEDVLTSAAVTAMREFVLEAAGRIGVESSHRGTARHLANLVGLDPMFFPVIDHPKVLPLVEAIMGPDVILGSLNARVVRPGEPRQTLHSDVPLPLHRYGTEAPVMMNTIWPLHDYTADNGATWVVPGSHQSHLHEPPPDFDVKYGIQPAIPAGSVVVCNGQTWHGGGGNRSSEPRAAMFGHFRYGQWLRFQCDPHDQFPAEWHDQLNERQKQLLRMTQGVGVRHGADFYER